MPISILLAGAAVASGLVGVKEHSDAKSNNNTAEYLIKKANTDYNDAKANLEMIKQETEDALLTLGYKKKDIMLGAMNRFLKSYEKVKDVKIHSSVGLNEITNLMITEDGAIQIREIGNIYTNALKSGATGAIAGTIMGLAASGSLGFVTGAMGLAGSLLTMGEISAAVELTGSALALGIASTPLSAVVAPIVLFTGISANLKAEENLLEAKKVEAQAKAAIEQIETMVFMCESVIARSNMFYNLISLLDDKFELLLPKLEDIIVKKEHEYIDVRKAEYTDEEIAIIAVSRAIAGAIKSVVDTPILSKDGELTMESYETENKTAYDLHGIYDSVGSLIESKSVDESEQVSEILLKADSYYYGDNGCLVDLIKAEQYYKQAAELGSDEATKQLGNIACDKKCYDEAVKYYQIAADRGYAKAQNNLAIRYEKGQGVEKNIKKALELYTQAANAGLSAAAYNLGLIYCNNDGVERNYYEAFNWYMKAAISGNVEAEYNVGIFYYEGKGVPEKNLDYAKKWLKRAEHSGKTDALLYLGKIAEEEKEYDEAIQYFEILSAQGNEDRDVELNRLRVLKSGYVASYIPDRHKSFAEFVCNSMDEVSTFELAKKLFLDGQLDDSFEIFMNLASLKRNAPSMYFLGEFFAQPYGHIVKNSNMSQFWRNEGGKLGDVLSRINIAYTYPQDSKERNVIFEENFDELKELANSGDAIALNELADLYLGAYNNVKDIQKGIDCLEKSSQLGYWRSTSKIGDIYYNGEYVTRNYSKAIEYYSLASQKGYGVAANSLGNMYFSGTGCTKDYIEGLECYKRGIECGNNWAMYNYANMFYNGSGVPTNYIKAFKYYGMAAEYGNSEAANMVGIMYFKGQGVQKSDVLEFQWMKKAAEMGLAQGQSNLANCYYAGRGVDKDLIKARYWYKKAADGGNQYAKEQLAKLL